MKRMIWVCKAKDLVSRAKSNEESGADKKYLSIDFIMNAIGKDTLVFDIKDGIVTERT